MATAHGPESATEASSVHFMDGIGSRFAETDDRTHDGLDSVPSMYDDGRMPNPPFVFPAQPESPPPPPPSFSRTSGRRPMSAIETPTAAFGLTTENLNRHRPAALPAFSFNPGASLPSDPHSMLLSPPITPNTPRTIPSSARPGGHGHRRGGSEFVGGSIREGNSIAVMSTSPTKSESGFASPTFQPPRRGHRRGVSSAISTNDLPIFLPPPDLGPIKGSSAPSSPTGFESHAQTPISLMDEQLITPEPLSDVEISVPPEKPKAEVVPLPDETPKPELRPGARARVVGFSETLEFIPRPLSLVSSDGSSTMTMRPGHAVSGSLSSVVPISSPTGRDSPALASRSPTRDANESRPSTAGAILERTQYPTTGGVDISPRRRNSIPALVDVANETTGPSAAMSSAKSSKRWSFFGLEALAGSGSPTKRRPSSSCSSDSTQKAASSTSDLGSESMNESAPDSMPKPKKTGKKGKRKRKMKGWAGSILPRKTKTHGKRPKASAVRPPTPPAPTLPSDDEEDEAPEAVETDEPADAPIVTVTESPALPPLDTPKPRSEEVSYQMIDLDAALGPFNTPLPHNPEWEAAQRAAGNTGKRRLHSAQGMKGFSGPGMHYHRRAESAPDLPPFDPGRASLHRFGSSSTMDDVFEEDEDEADTTSETRSETAQKQAESSSESDGETIPPAASTRDERPPSQDQAPPIVRRTSSGLSDKDQSSARSIRAERSRTSLHEEVIIEEPSLASFHNMFHGSHGSTGSLAHSPKRLPAARDLGPVDINPLHLGNTAATTASLSSMSHGSPYPSPRSPMSVDAQRISTAPSSVNDENNFQSLLMGEPGPEVRISVDYDIPSLTSSTSATTRESFVPHSRILPSMTREQRPVSVSSAFGRRRSSLVSLSRLISSSHGERSKLSMEVRLDNEPESRKPKSNRTKRLGRMMQFWKPHKESPPS